MTSSGIHRFIPSDLSIQNIMLNKSITDIKLINNLREKNMYIYIYI